MQEDLQTENSRQKPNSASSPTLLLGVAGYIFVVLVPAIVATFDGGQLLAHGMIQYGVTMSGVVAYSIISMQFVLVARFKWIVKPFGFPAVLRFHKTMAVVATLLTFVHVAMLVLSRGNWNVVLNPLASWPIQLGRVVVLALFAILAISFGRKLIPINNADWRWFHNALAWLILIFVCAQHGDGN